MTRPTVQVTQKLAVDFLEAESRLVVTWFTLNQMLANPEKFQAIFQNCVEHDMENANIRNQIIIRITWGKFRLKT